MFLSLPNFSWRLATSHQLIYLPGHVCVFALALHLRGHPRHIPQPESWVATWTAWNSIQVVPLGVRGMEAKGLSFCQVVTMSVPPCCHTPDRLLFNALKFFEEAVKTAAHACWWAEKASRAAHLTDGLTECTASIAQLSVQTATQSDLTASLFAALVTALLVTGGP